MLPAIIGAGAVLGAALLGSRSAEKNAARAAESAEMQSLRNIEFQKEFAQNGIQWRVEDAKAAGLHPLFALGASTPSFSPNPVVVSDDRSGEIMARGVADAGRSFSEHYYRNQALELQAKQAETGMERDQAQAAYYRALAAKELQALNARPPVPDAEVFQGVPNRPQPREGFYDRIETKAAPTFSRSSNDGAAMAGSKPMWQPWQLRDGGLMLDVPYSDEGPMESLREMPLWMMPEFVRHNTQKYGGDWLVKFLEAYPDNPVMKWLLDSASNVASMPGRGLRAVEDWARESDRGSSSR